MSKRRHILLAIAGLALAPRHVLAEVKKKIPDWNRGEEEIEEAKFAAAFDKLKDDADFRKAAFAGDADQVIAFFNKSTNTDYNVDVSFRGRGQKSLRFAIDCNRRADGQWQFSIKLSRL